MFISKKDSDFVEEDEFFIWDKKEFIWEVVLFKKLVIFWK